VREPPNGVHLGALSPFPRLPGGGTVYARGAFGAVVVRKRVPCRVEPPPPPVRVARPEEGYESTNQRINGATRALSREGPAGHRSGRASLAMFPGGQRGLTLRAKRGERRPDATGADARKVSGPRPTRTGVLGAPRAAKPDTAGVLRLVGAMNRRGEGRIAPDRPDSPWAAGRAWRRDRKVQKPGSNVLKEGMADCPKGSRTGRDLSRPAPPARRRAPKALGRPALRGYYPVHWR
jgi:hypothetical protein